MRKLAFAAAAVAALVAGAFLFLPALVEWAMNRVRQDPPYPAPEWARALSRGSADLHADPLLWGRDLLERGTRGQLDLPRLLDAGSAFQVFSVVTQVPLVRHDPRTPDVVTALAFAGRWPRRTWGSPFQRALYQAERLRAAVRGSGRKLALVTSHEEFSRLRPGTVGALLALEGVQPLEGKLENLTALYDAGYRMMAPTHFADSEVAGSAHGLTRGGLTPLGRLWLSRLEEKRIIVDLAHASPKAVEQVLAAATRPVVVSHTGVRGTCDNERNLSDEQLRALAKNGAVVGIGYWETATCGADARAAARAVRHAADVMGVEHVGLGSDFDGAVRQPFDATGLPLLVEALRAERFTDAEIGAIVSGNVLRLLSQLLP